MKFYKSKLAEAIAMEQNVSLVHEKILKEEGDKTNYLNFEQPNLVTALKNAIVNLKAKLLEKESEKDDDNVSIQSGKSSEIFDSGTVYEQPAHKKACKGYSLAFRSMNYELMTQSRE